MPTKEYLDRTGQSAFAVYLPVAEAEAFAALADLLGERKATDLIRKMIRRANRHGRNRASRQRFAQELTEEK